MRSATSCWFGRRTTVLFCLAILVTPPVVAGPPDISGLLAEADYDAAQQQLADHLATDDADDLARFQLGTVRLLAAVEQLAQDGVRYGAKTEAVALPFLRVGGFAGNQQDAQPVAYEDLRRLVAEFQESVAQAEETLAGVTSDSLKWTVNFNRVKLDLDADGKLANSETLENLFRGLKNRRQQRQPEGEELRVRFDTADVYWLRGYCHVLMAMADMTLAYDHRVLFEHTAHRFFADPQTEFARERGELGDQPRGGFDRESLSDLIAMVHLINFEPREPGRLADARRHWLQMVAMSRESWDHISREEDNHLEWIPGPQQDSVITDLVVDEQRVTAWHAFLAEAEAVLNGDRRVPFWRRGFPEHGVNLRRVFEEPRDFDLVLWVQGAAALPYLERGEQTTPQTWREFMRVFRGDFLGFAMWVN